ncbi:MAG: acyltransferase [Chitinophagaceae bacterium]|nr:acyltransferase [Chitinophagaceae bacterium]
MHSEITMESLTEKRIAGNETNAIDFLRKVIYKLFQPFRFLAATYRKIRFYFYTKSWLTHILGHVHINTISHQTSIGENATLYPNVIFELNQHSILRVGERFTLSYGAVISCQHSITIGNYVMIGEYTSIRDTSHGYSDTKVPYCRQPDIPSAITIGNNVWIGRGSIILPGSVIEDGVIVAANSVVKGRLESNSLYGGAPARLIKRITS